MYTTHTHTQLILINGQFGAKWVRFSGTQFMSIKVVHKKCQYYFNSKCEWITGFVDHVWICYMFDQIHWPKGSKIGWKWIWITSTILDSLVIGAKH